MTFQANQSRVALSAQLTTFVASGYPMAWVGAAEIW
jgi:hypothetical protein